MRQEEKLVKIQVTFLPSTLSSYNQACHAVGYTGSCCQEGYTHDVVRDVQCKADNGDLIKGNRAGSNNHLETVALFTLQFTRFCLLTIHTMRQEKTAIHRVEATNVTMNQRCQRGRMQLGTVQQRRRPRGQVITHFTRAQQLPATRKTQISSIKSLQLLLAERLMLHFLSSYCSDTVFPAEKNAGPTEAARAAINWSTPSIFSFLECPSQSPELQQIIYSINLLSICSQKRPLV